MSREQACMYSLQSRDWIAFRNNKKNVAKQQVRPTMHVQAAREHGDTRQKQRKCPILVGLLVDDRDNLARLLHSPRVRGHGAVGVLQLLPADSPLAPVDLTGARKDTRNNTAWHGMAWHDSTKKNRENSEWAPHDRQATAAACHFLEM